MAISNAEKLRRVHARMLKRFDRIWGATRDERLQCMQDRRFCAVPGAQWEGALGEQFANRPRFEMNKTRKAVNRIVGEYRQNRVEARFLPANDAPATQSAADAATGMYRAACVDPLAAAAKDNAFEESSMGGIGAWRLRPIFENERDPGDEHQHVIVEPIYDADVRAFMDDNSLRPDKADAKWGFLITPYTYEAFAEAFGDETDPASWPIDRTLHQFDWVTTDSVFVAEYYEIEQTETTLRVWRHLDGNEQRVMSRDIEADPDLERWLGAVGAKMTAERQVKLPVIRKYMATGAEVIKDCGRIPGEYIPIIMTYGMRSVVDGVERCAGAVRVAKDPQRLKNMLTSKLADIAGGSSVSKPIFTPRQIAGHTTLWAEDHIKNNPYLLINELLDPQTGQPVVAPVSYLQPATVPQPLGALLELAEFDIKDLLGSAEQGERMVSNVSEETVSMAQQQIDLQTYVYTSNFQRAERYAAMVWLGMARELFVERGRKVRTAQPDGKLERVELQRRTIDDKSGAAFISADLPGADLDLEISFGPSSTSRRNATVRDLTKMLAIVKDPETVAVVEALAMMNMEGEGLSGTRPYFRKKLLAIGAVEPTEDERQELEAQKAAKPEDANTAYLRAAAENEVAKAIKARADTLLALARAEEARANAAATSEGVDRAQVDQLVSLSNELGAGLAPTQPAPQSAAPGAPQAPTQPASI